MTRLVRDRMSTRLVTVPPTAPMKDVLALLREKRIRHLPVVEADGRLVGLLTDRDAVGRALGPMSWLADAEQDQALTEMLAREVMTDELRTIGPDASLLDAATTLLDAKIGCLPVVADGKLVGILCESDFVAEFAGR